MDTLWVLAVVIGVVAGDVGLGYHYKVPHTSYGVPTYHGSTTSNGYTGGLGLGSGNSYSQFGSGLGSGYYTGQSGFGQSTIGQSSIGQSSVGQSSIGQSSIGQSSIGQSSIGQSSFGPSTVGPSTISQSSVGQSSSDLNSIFGQNTGYVSGFQNAGSSASAISGADTGSNYYQSGFVQPTYQTGDFSAFNQFQSSQYQSSAADKYQQYYNVIQQQPAQVFKHYYVHAAPEEPEVPKSRQPIVLPPPQKHYKIIFIKAPSTPAQAPQVIPVQSQNEEKTIVYVLVKKPEEAQNIVLPKIEQKTPTKPEVYFIKYNNKQDSQAVINNIVSDLNKGNSDAATYSAVGASDQGSASGATAQVFGQGVGLAEGQGASAYDSSSSIGSTSFGSGSASSNAFGSGSASSNAFGSGVSSSSSFDSNSSGASSSFGSSLGSSNAFAVSDGAKGQTVSVSTVDSGSDSGYDASFGSSISSTASTLTGYDASAISTSQGVPHETYGPPKFRVL